MFKNKLTFFFFLMLWPSTVWATCSAPVGGEGQLRYDSATKKVYVCDGTSWGQVGGSSTPDIQVATGALVTASCASTCTDTKTSTATCPAGYKFAAGNCYLPSSWSWSFANTATTYSCTVSVSNTARQIQAVAYCIK